MSWWYRTLVRPVLFTQDAELIHNRAMRNLNRLARSERLSRLAGAFCRAEPLPVSAIGLRFVNPMGLAAGMDKNAEALPAWAHLGFGFTELGAVTWHTQPGNATPRVFRAIPEQAIVNRMGFNNAGAEAVAAELANWRESGLWPNHHPVGMNLGKSKVTPLGQAPEDYAKSLRALWLHLDFFVINVSSPNTPNLRELQDRDALAAIFAAVQSVNRELAGSAENLKPLLVKVAPDLSLDALDQILELLPDHRIAGIVATNTTISRPETADPSSQRVFSESGGLSGAPLRKRSTEMIRHIYRQSGGKVPIIGVGGIFNAAHAWEKIVAGATLLQVYTGFVFEGPTLVAEIVRGLKQRLDEARVSSLADAVGAETRGDL
jgi:dihydroorotate dehydrogenase